MMRYILLLLALSLSVTCKADLGTCFCFEAVIESGDSVFHTAYFTIRGYDFYIENQQNQYVYSTKLGKVPLPLKGKTGHDFELYHDTAFSGNVLNLIWDSLKFHTDYIKLNYELKIEEYQDIKLIGDEFVIAKKDIKQLIVKRLMPCGVGSSILSLLAPKDKKWITEVQKVNYLGGPEMCGYSSFHFKIPSEEVIKLEENLKNILKEYADVYLGQIQDVEIDMQSIYDNIDKHIELLKKQQVIVSMSCAC